MSKENSENGQKKDSFCGTIWSTTNQIVTPKNAHFNHALFLTCPFDLPMFSDMVSYSKRLTLHCVDSGNGIHKIVMNCRLVLRHLKFLIGYNRLREDCQETLRTHSVLK